MSTDNRVWLTPEAHDRLRIELATLTQQRTTRVDDREALRMLESDPEFLDDARRRQGRIRQIHDLLGNAVVGEAPPDDGIAEPGMVLTVRFDADNETETFLLGTREGVDADGLQVYSPTSPLGMALSGARRGDQRSYLAPNGVPVHVTLLDAVPYGGHEAR